MPQNVVHILLDSLDLAVEVLAFVVNQHPSRVAHVRFSQLLVLFARFLMRFIPRDIIDTRVELFCAVSRRNHVQNSVIAIITKHGQIAVHIVQKRLPVLLTHIGAAIKQTPINQDNHVFIDHLGNVDESVLKFSLKLH